MNISEQDFEGCMSISIDNSFVQPRIKMCRDKENKQLIHQFECPNEEKAEELFEQLLGAWGEIKKLSARHTG